jgi:cytochrome c-type biogenesis protein CcmE
MKARHKRLVFVTIAIAGVAVASGDLTMTFVVTDTAKKVTVSYTGILPDLFGEGQGVVTRGKLGGDGVFYAEEVLAKHDESYMPPEVQDAVDKAQKMGVAKKDAGQPQSSVNY